jgi:uncharacterized SAM-binding protein YcdF (DUF218 family)
MSPLSNYLIESLEYEFVKNIADEVSGVEYISVLGNGHISNSSFPQHAQIKEESLKRCLQGYYLLKKYPQAKIIFSGYGGSDPISNAQIMASFAMSLGVESNKIIVLPHPRDTFEESLAIKKIVKDKKFILVSSASHLRRSLAYFKKNEMNPIPSAGHFYYENKVVKNWEDYPSQSKYLKMNEVFWHETIGMIWWKVKQIFKI